MGDYNRETGQWVSCPSVDDFTSGRVVRWPEETPKASVPIFTAPPAYTPPPIYTPRPTTHRSSDYTAPRVGHGGVQTSARGIPRVPPPPLVCATQPNALGKSKTLLQHGLLQFGFGAVWALQTLIAAYLFLRIATDAAVRHAGVGLLEERACGLYVLSSVLFACAVRGKLARMAITGTTALMLVLLVLDLH